MFNSRAGAIYPIGMYDHPPHHTWPFVHAGYPCSRKVGGGVRKAKNIRIQLYG